MKNNELSCNYHSPCYSKEVYKYRRRGIKIRENEPTYEIHTSENHDLSNGDSVC